MKAIVLRCPTTGIEYTLGVETDEASFNSLPDRPMTARCPYCGIDHEWRPVEARLSQGEQPRAPQLTTSDT